MYNSSSSLLFKSNRCTFTVALPSEIWWQFAGWIKLLPLSKVKRLRSTFNYCFKQSFVYLRCPLFSQLRSKQINTMQFLLILTRSFGLIFLNMGGEHIMSLVRALVLSAQIACIVIRFMYEEIFWLENL